MKSFFNILQTIVNVKYKKYPDEPFTIFPENNEPYTEIKLHINYLINQIFYEEQCDRDFISHYDRLAFAKLYSLNTIITNSFYQKQLKEEIINIFSKAQKYYNAFSRLARIYKIKKYKFVVTDDLSMCPLDPNHKNTFILIENKAKYLFSINDLISIIETAIGNSPNFFSEPLSPVNPYNKQRFSISTLYNIYFKMKESGRLISVLFHFFFLENFSKYNFFENYEHFIRENAIKKYIFNSPYTVLYPNVFDMLENNFYTKNYRIHKDFPKELLVNIFRPFLYYYYIVNYDIKGTNKIYNYKQVLHNKLRKFYLYNKTFGRQYIQITRYQDKIIKKEYKFMTDHITFYGICSDGNNDNNNNNNNNNNDNNDNNNNNNNILNFYNTTISNIYDTVPISRYESEAIIHHIENNDDEENNNDEENNEDNEDNGDSNSESNSENTIEQGFSQNFIIEDNYDEYNDDEEEIDSIS